MHRCLISFILLFLRTLATRPFIDNKVLISANLSDSIINYRYYSLIEEKLHETHEPTQIPFFGAFLKPGSLSRHPPSDQWLTQPHYIHMLDS